MTFLSKKGTKVERNNLDFTKFDEVYKEINFEYEYMNPSKERYELYEFFKDIKNSMLLPTTTQNDVDDAIVKMKTRLGYQEVKVEQGQAEKQEYKKGEEVKVTANEAQEGYVFDKWTSEDIEIENPTSKQIKFTMPEKQVTLKANYKEYKPITDIKITTDTMLMLDATTDIQLQVTPIPFHHHQGT